MLWLCGRAPTLCTGAHRPSLHPTGCGSPHPSMSSALPTPVQGPAPKQSRAQAGGVAALPELWRRLCWAQTSRYNTTLSWREGVAVAYNDDSAADGDPGHEAVGDGVCLVGVADGVIVAVEASLVGGVHQSQDDEGQRRCKAQRGEDWGQQPAHSTSHLPPLSLCSPMPGRDPHSRMKC